jgi:hypothetical protein
MSFIAIIVILLLSLALHTKTKDWETDKINNIAFGLTQAIFAKGFKIEGNYIHNCFIFDYSHSASLDSSGQSVTAEMRKKGLAVHKPWTTGFGIEYRLKVWVNVRIDLKCYRFEFYYNYKPQKNASQIMNLP